MAYSVAPLSRLIDQFARLPGIGRKTAQRLALFVLNLPEGEAEGFARCILDARQQIHRCAVCCNLTDEEQCTVCGSAERDHSTICVVSDPRDVLAIERTREFTGVYHVLHGVISPMDGIGPEQLTLKQLLARIDDTVSEVIMATGATVEGDATAMYISRLLKPMGIKCTRLAYGIPVGGDLEYADEVTLGRALDGRSEM
ncbi:MAG: recombination protein RecR [Ruminococcaceae bacterium]|nr:recombination protein RecR [Oscillospiraceae bacterium]